MAGLLDIVRAAIMPAAAARTGTLQGEEIKRQRGIADEQRQRSNAHQTLQDQLAVQDRTRAESARADATKRQGILDQSRIALEGAQTAEVKARAGRNTAQAGYYERGKVKGSGPNGALTPKDKQRFIGARLQRYMTPRFDDYGDPIPGTGLDREDALAEAERDWTASVGDEQPAAPTGGGMAAMRVRGAGMAPVPSAPAAPPATGAPAKPDSLMSQTRAAIAPPSGAAPSVDSAALAKKYPYLFNQ